MNGKYKLPLKKIGGSIYCLIPSGLTEELEIKNDNEILASFEKYGDLTKELCKKYSESGEEVRIIYENKELTGTIAFLDNESITLSSDKMYVLPYRLIKEIKLNSGGKNEETNLRENQEA